MKVLTNCEGVGTREINFSCFLELVYNRHEQSFFVDTRMENLIQDSYNTY